MAIFNSYVKLPEGTYVHIYVTYVTSVPHFQIWSHGTHLPGAPGHRRSDYTVRSWHLCDQAEYPSSAPARGGLRMGKWKDEESPKGYSRTMYCRDL